MSVRATKRFKKLLMVVVVLAGVTVVEDEVEVTLAGVWVTLTLPNCPVWLVATVFPSPGMNRFTPVCIRAVRSHRPERQHIHDVLRIRRRKRARVLGDVLSGDVTGKNNRVARRRHVDLLIREQAVHFFRSRGDIDIHPKVEALRALKFIPDQQ
jgi:hypothetical protein